MTFVPRARPALLRLVLAGLLSLCEAGTVLAQSNARIATAQTPVELVRDGRFDEARAVLGAALAGRADAAIHAAYLEGLIAARRGDDAAAIRIFRDILTVAPEHEAARRELAALLLLTRRMEAALYHAERLGPSNTRLRDRIRADVAAGRGPDRGASLRFSLTPSTNANRGTAEDSIAVGGLRYDIDQTAREAAGTSVSLGGTLWRRWSLGARTTGTLTGSLDHARDLDGDSPQTTAALSYLVSHQAGPLRLTFGPELERRLTDGRVRRDRMGVTVSGSVPVGERAIWLATFDWQQQLFPDRSYADGTRAALNVGLRYRLAPRLILSATLEAEREAAERDHLAHTEIGPRLGLEGEWSGGWLAMVEVSRHLDRYDGDFPGLTKARRDETSAIGLRLSNRALSWNGLTPEISVTALRAASNVPFYRFEAVDLGLLLSRRF